jgi:NAD(P)-dependent dehydrogenase (short-subunit alcohol dehydrogenase family)
MRPKQKVAVITGASRVIGAALVKAYGNRDYTAVATARPRDDDVLIVSGDIADPPSARSSKAQLGSGASTR